MEPGRPPAARVWRRMWALYQTAFLLALLAAGPLLLARRGRHYLSSLPVRFGRFDDGPSSHPLWIHAVSVGEVEVAATLAAALPAMRPLLVTTVTPAGQALARRRFDGRATVTYLPFDLGFPVRRFFRRFGPSALVLSEGDLWPLVLREAERHRLPIAVVNGRVSDRSFARMRRLRPLLGPLLEGVDRFGVQTDEDGLRLAALGVPPERIQVTGNLKFEAAEPEPRPELARRLREVAGGRPILVAGSTMSDEEPEVLEAFARLGGGRRALLLLAPRHPERWPAVEELARGRGLNVARRTALDAAEGADVVVLDSMGELAALYPLGAAAFLGGTLVPAGGHNPLEPARSGVPVAAGPSMENFREIAARFDAAGAWRRVASAGDLARVWEGWLDRPQEASAVGERGARLVAANRGALARTLEMLEPLVRADPE